MVNAKTKERVSDIPVLYWRNRIEGFLDYDISIENISCDVRFHPTKNLILQKEALNITKHCVQLL